MIISKSEAGEGADAGSQFQQHQSFQTSGRGLNVIFITASEATGKASATIMVQCMPDDKVSDVIKKYRNWVNDRDPSIKFIFNDKNLSPSLSVYESDITNNANIFVFTTTLEINKEILIKIPPGKDKDKYIPLPCSIYIDKKD